MEPSFLTLGFVVNKVAKGCYPPTIIPTVPSIYFTSNVFFIVTFLIHNVVDFSTFDPNKYEPMLVLIFMSQIKGPAFVEYQFIVI